MDDNSNKIGMPVSNSVQNRNDALKNWVKVRDQQISGLSQGQEPSIWSRLADAVMRAPSEIKMDLAEREDSGWHENNEPAYEAARDDLYNTAYDARLKGLTPESEGIDPQIKAKLMQWQSLARDVGK